MLCGRSLLSELALGKYRGYSLRLGRSSPSGRRPVAFNRTRFHEASFAHRPSQIPLSVFAPQALEKLPLFSFRGLYWDLAEWYWDGRVGIAARPPAAWPSSAWCRQTPACRETRRQETDNMNEMTRERENVTTRRELTGQTRLAPVLKKTQ